MTAFLWEAIIFLCLMVGILFLFMNTFKGMQEDAAMKRAAKREMKRRKASMSGESGEGRVSRYVQMFRYNLSLIKMPVPMFYGFEAGAFILGFFAGKLILTRLSLAMLMALLFLLLPIVLVTVRASWYTQREAAMLENCMVIITGSYRANKDIIKAIGDNMNKPNMPKAFKNFYHEVSMVNPSVEQALMKLKLSFNNRYFDEWVDVLIKSQHDSTMMEILPVIIDEMDEAKKAQNESHAALKAVWREYAIWVITVFCVPLVLKINDKWYSALVDTVIGKCLVVALLVGLCNTLRCMIKINRPKDL